MTGFSFYDDERTDITHTAGAAAKDVLLPRFQKNLFAMTCFKGEVRRKIFIGSKFLSDPN